MLELSDITVRYDRVSASIHQDKLRHSVDVSFAQYGLEPTDLLFSIFQDRTVYIFRKIWKFVIQISKAHLIEGSE